MVNVTHCGTVSCSAGSRGNQVGTKRGQITSRGLACLCVTVMDGEDLSQYDGLPAPRTQQEEEDSQTLDELEWELASQSGRITGKWEITKSGTSQVSRLTGEWLNWVE